MIRTHARTASVSLVLLIGAAAGVTAYTRVSAAPTGIALVNADTGPTGARVLESVQQTGGYDWHILPAEAAVAGDYAAVITLPADLTDAMTTLAGHSPRRARLTVEIHDDAENATVEGAITTVSRQIGAAGITTALEATAHARTHISSAQFTAQLLGTGLDATVVGTEQFAAGTEQLLDLVEVAETGVAQLSSAIDSLTSMLDDVAEQAGQLATALDTTEITLSDARQAADATTTGLDRILPVLHALPGADAAPIADIIAKLQAVRDVSGQVATQLDDPAGQFGTGTDPDAGLGTTLHDLAGRLTSISDQLDQGSALAGDIPGRADEGVAQLLDAAELLESGIGRLQHMVSLLGTQTAEASAASAPAGPAHQAALAQALVDPVEVVRE
ncbi:YhgE/Pip domain-containing protein [Nocardia flavorosea]|uniref:Uncharacterized protein n=1 Tax=Nocardia flavorosea TaxID=53429 RepID=A0A846YNL2_9NOCA|nr:hypothetical protein [Nocardia flavorosea]NKY59134.1 hypothetical protein [Nocardia flavorosea]